jgi:hypothetical protein
VIIYSKTQTGSYFERIDAAANALAWQASRLAQSELGAQHQTITGQSATPGRKYVPFEGRCAKRMALRRRRGASLVILAAAWLFAPAPAHAQTGVVVGVSAVRGAKTLQPFASIGAFRISNATNHAAGLRLPGELSRARPEAARAATVSDDDRGGPAWSGCRAGADRSGSRARVPLTGRRPAACSRAVSIAT